MLLIRCLLVSQREREQECVQKQVRIRLLLGLLSLVCVLNCEACSSQEQAYMYTYEVNRYTCF